MRRSSLPGFLAGLTYACYSLWVDSLYQANCRRHPCEQNFLLPDYDPVKAHQDRARENIRLTKYADRQWVSMSHFSEFRIGSTTLLVTIVSKHSNETT